MVSNLSNVRGEITRLSSCAIRSVMAFLTSPSKIGRVLTIKFERRRRCHTFGFFGNAVIFIERPSGSALYLWLT